MKSSSFAIGLLLLASTAHAGSAERATSKFTFEYGTGPDGWQFAAPPGFTPPTQNSTGGSLSLTSTNNNNTFGWWESPRFIVGSPQTSGELELLGSPGPNSLFRTTMVVSSDQLTGSDVPVVRMRVSTSSFEQTDALSITSVGGGQLSPTITTKTYKLYHSLPDTQNRFQSFIDILNFDPTDAPTATVNIERADIESIGGTQLFDPRFERSWNFTFAQSNGWTARFADGLSQPFAVPETQGLRLGPASTVSQVAFGFWGSPEFDGNAVRFEAGRLYRADFVVNSSAVIAQKSLVPAFRVRVNDSSNQLSAYQNIESISADSRVPTSGATEKYTLWFEAPPVLSGNTLNFSFDYLLVPESLNDPNIFIWLESARVESYLAPF